MLTLNAEQERIAVLQAELELARAARRAAEAERDALLHSTSWRTTRPLRLAGAKLPIPVRRLAARLSRSISGLAALPFTSKRPPRAPTPVGAAVVSKPTRAEVLLAPVPPGSRIIEIGPSFSPIAPKSAGWNTVSIDHLTRDGLIAKYCGQPGVDVNRIEPVDFLWVSGPLSDAIPQTEHGCFDAFVASHVIEHTPDLIDFLDSAATLVKPQGVVVLAVPDKRYCFDYFQPLTTTGQLLEAHHSRRSRHARRLVFDHVAYSVQDGGVGAWGQRPSLGINFAHRLEEAHAASAGVETNPVYIDVHAWRFVPASFELLMLEIARLGETDWQVERTTPAAGCEFFAWLRRGGAASAAALSAEELNARRLMLLKRTLLETRAQIDWLVAGEPALGGGARPT
jgi:SAM-dependent methyltransferase